jgi:hypothetical protein
MRASIVVGMVLVLAACNRDKAIPGQVATEGKSVDVDRPAATGSTCGTDTDCVISCDTKADCCTDPGCTKAVMASAAQDVLTYRTAHCSQADIAKCPDIPAPKFTIRAACEKGACVAIKHDASQ